jgi:glutathione S-transferase
MGITLHHAHQARSMRSLWLLHELGVEFDLVVHDFDKSLRSPEYLALHPVGRVPVLEIDGVSMFETGAICEDLCERFPGAGLGCSAEDPERAQWLIWVHFAESISQHVAALTQQHIVLYEDSMRSPIITKLEAARLVRNYQAVEARLEGRDYLLDRGFSAVDIGVGQAVYMGRKFAKIEPFPNLTEWYARLVLRNGFKESLPPEGADLIYKRDFYEVLNG